LISRIEAHIKNREVTCEVCGKMFCTIRQLKDHIVLHNEASFVCTFDGCNKAFSVKSYFTRHIKTHGEKRDHKCHLCDKAYFFNRDLKRHFDTAHKRTTFFCEMCTYSHNRKEMISKHWKKVHNLSREACSEAIKNVKFVKKSI
jgi:Zinc finger, C2H2 type